MRYIPEKRGSDARAHILDSPGTSGTLELMALVSSAMVPLGSPLPQFNLPTVESLAGGSHETVSRDDFRGSPLLVVFLCRHCPYVKHIQQKLGEVINNEIGDLPAVGICSNDPDQYPEDAPSSLVQQKEKLGWQFPYLFDDTQEIARAFHAIATPDLFLYDADHKLAWRGAFDTSSPGNSEPVSGELLKNAARYVLAGQSVPEPHIPSMGCSIKFRD